MANEVNAASTPLDIPAINSPAIKSRIALQINIPGTSGITLEMVMIF